MTGKPAYRTQFHPEMTADELRERLEVYRNEHLSDPGEFERLTGRFRPSPRAAGPLRRFLDLVAG